MMNTAFLLGRVGHKETKELKNGGEITILSLATNKRYKDSEGNRKQSTTWHNVNCFSKLSELARSYIHVGDLVLIQGEIQHKKIEAGDRAGQYIYSIHANDIKFIPTGNNKNSKEEADGNNIEEDNIPF